LSLSYWSTHCSPQRRRFVFIEDLCAEGETVAGKVVFVTRGPRGPQRNLWGLCTLADGGFMKSSNDKSLRWRIVQRSVLPAILLTLWVATCFGDLEAGRSWSQGKFLGMEHPFGAPALPLTAASSNQYGRWYVRSADGAMFINWYSISSSFTHFAAPAPLTTKWFCDWKSLHADGEHIAGCISGLHGGDPTDFNASHEKIDGKYSSPPVPYFLLTALASIPLIHLLWANRRSVRRQSAGVCPNCAYNLRAHHVGQCCPECGTPIAPNIRPAL
jgi:hypothetical protein